MNALGERIARLIQSQGPLSIAQFMTLALHDPQDGYYATRDPLGRTGDFITAPEVSQMFGELLGLWIVQCWRDQDCSKQARLVELGPGRGTLMADALRTIARVAPAFLAAIEIVLIEASPALRQIQSETLSKFAGVRWLSQFDDSLAGRPLFLLANEFFDALLVRQYVKTERGWCERMVILDESGALSFALAPVPMAGMIVPEARGEAEDGAVYEISPPAIAIAEEVAQIVSARGGAALIVDYGHDGSGFGDTLQAVKGHKYAGLLDAPGEADLSAHVDFAALSAAALRGGAKPYGPVAQGVLLEKLGLRQRAEQLSSANPLDAAAMASAVERLIGGREMGTLFKALAILPERAPPPPGF